jgi:hypothetical protein
MIKEIFLGVTCREEGEARKLERAEEEARYSCY